VVRVARCFFIMSYEGHGVRGQKRDRGRERGEKRRERKRRRRGRGLEDQQTTGGVQEEAPKYLSK
jgi:hypothetical protein